jgi:nicotinate phosphoribosyltransferase
VYKLVAVCDQDRWVPAIKISESPSKTPNPGHKEVWRIYDRRGNATADLLALPGEEVGNLDRIQLRHPSDHTKQRILVRGEISEVEPLLVDILQEGKLVVDLPDIESMRATRQADVERLDPGVRRIMYPHIYHVSLTQSLWMMKQKLISEALGWDQVQS